MDQQALQQLLDAELARQRRVDNLFTLMDRLDKADIPPMTNDEINEEIRAARAERRAEHARRS